MNEDNLLSIGVQSGTVDWLNLSQADTEAENRSLGDSAVEFVKDAGTAIALTGVSAAVGLANTLPLIANATGGEGTMEYLSTLRFAEKMDEAFQTGRAVDFYNEHSEGVELGGAILGGIIPGLGSLKAAQVTLRGAGTLAGKLAAMESDHIIGRSAAWIAGYANTSRKTQILRKSYESILNGQSALSGLSMIDRGKLALSMGASAAFETAAFEMGATLAQMKNPTYDDIDSLGDFTKHIAVAGAFGFPFGALGGSIFWKSARFLPTDKALTETTLRETVNKIKSTEELILSHQDWGEKLKMAPGTKLAALYDDFTLDANDIKSLTKELSAFLPPDRQDAVTRFAQEWTTKRDTQIRNLIEQQVLALTKDTSDKSTLGKDVLDKIFITQDGDPASTGSYINWLIGGATKLRKVEFNVSSSGRVVPETVTNLDPNIKSQVIKILNTAPNMVEYTSVVQRLDALKQTYKSFGVPFSTSLKNLPDPLAKLWGEKKDILAKMGKMEEDIPSIGDFTDNPLLLTKQAMKNLGLSNAQISDISRLLKLENRPTTFHIYDMDAKMFVDQPALKLGDILDTPKSLSGTPSGDILAGGKALSKGVYETLRKNEPAKDSIESQLLWTVAPKTITKKSGDKLLGPDGVSWNPYRLAAAIDADIPIQYNGATITRDMALNELRTMKLRMYNHAKTNLNLSEDAARYYADLPLEGRVSADMQLTRGRENNFFTRRNVTIHYETEQPLTEFELKSIAATRQQILQKNMTAMNEAVRIANDLGIEIPPAMLAAFKRLQNHYIDGESPIDFMSRVGPGLWTNASGRMFKLNTLINAVSGYVQNQISIMQESIRKSMAADLRTVLQGVNKDAELDILRVIEKKVKGGGTKWFDVDAIVNQFGIASADLPEEILNAMSKNGMVLISRDLAKALAKNNIEQISSLLENLEKHLFVVDNQNVANLLRSYSGNENKLRKAQLDIMGSRGYNVINYMDGELYFPPLNIKKYPHFVLVRDDADSAIGGFSRYSFIHGRTSSEISEIVKKIQQAHGDKYTILTPQDLERDFKLKGELDKAKAFYSYNIDSDLASKNVFSEFLPRNGREIVEEMIEHLDSSARNSVRMLLKNWTGDFIDGTNRMSQAVDAYQKSIHGKARVGTTQADNTYAQINRAILGIGPGEESGGVLGAVMSIQNRAVEWLDNVYTAARNVAAAASANSPNMQARMIERLNATTKEANKIGLDLDHLNLPLFIEAERRLGKAAITGAFTRGLNSLSAMLVLGLDFANAIVQSLSLPLTINSAIRSLYNDAPAEIKQAINRVKVGGVAGRLGTIAARDFFMDFPEIRLYELARSGKDLNPNQHSKVTDWLATDRGRFYNEMVTLGLLPPSMRQMMIELGNVTNLRLLDEKGLQAKLVNMAQLLSGPTRYAETFQRFAALKVADGIANAANLTGADRVNMLHSFATQSAGVFTAAQRPGIFQGPIGGAFGLYKSYGINVMQALGRHIEDKDILGILGLAAVQGTIFGAKSIPGSDILNYAIRKQNDEDKRDLYTTAEILLGKAGGEAALYGLPSMFLGANLYSRGDLRPFDIITNPLDIDSFPAWQQFTGIIKAVGGIYTEASRTATGDITMMERAAALGHAVLNAAAHQSMSRPVARVAEFIQGTKTSREGAIIGEVNQSFGWNLAVRLAGAVPFDEAVTADAYYRWLQYRSEESEGMKKLRNAFRQSIVNNQGTAVDYENLAEEFIKNGGNAKEFRRWIRSQFNQANRGQIAEMQKALAKRGFMYHAQQLDQPWLD